MNYLNSSRLLRVLLIEDSKSSAILIQKELNRALPDSFTLIQASTLEEALKYLANQAFDIALLDRSLPDSHDFMGLYAIQNMAPDLPIIYLTNYKDEETAFESIRKGAQDYVIKDNLDGLLLKKSIQFAILRKEFEGVLSTRANFDQLTGLSNRMMYENRLEIALARVSGQNGNVAVLFLDIDKFKQINDTLGHAAGDEVLIEVAKRLKSVLRPYDTAARFGGDEFAVLIEEMPHIKDARAVAEKIIQLFSQPFDIAKTKRTVSISIGIAYATAGHTKIQDQIMREADEAMYAAKRLSGNTFFEFNDLASGR